MKNTRLSIDNLPALPRDQNGPVFNQPWEAKAFALAVHLSEAGCFTWPEWVRIKWVPGYDNNVAGRALQHRPNRNKCDPNRSGGWHIGADGRFQVAWSIHIRRLP